MFLENYNIAMGWIYLVLAGIFEVGFTTTLKLSEGFTKLWPSLGFLVASLLSFWFLMKGMQTIPLGTAYAVWTGLGVFGTSIIGMVYFSDPVSAGRIALLFILLSTVIGLKLIHK